MIDGATQQTIVIDYDGTWTLDPIAFAAFARMMRGRGHRVIVITARATGHGEVERETSAHVDRVLFSRGAPKRDCAVENGESVSVWIDDDPESIGASPMTQALRGDARRWE